MNEIVERWTKVYHKCTKHESSKLLVKIDYFSIYKIDSGQFNFFFKFCLKNTTIVYFCKRAHLSASSIHNHIQYCVRKTAVQLEKITSTHRFKFLYLGKEIKEEKATCLRFHMMKLLPFSCAQLVLESWALHRTTRDIQVFYYISDLQMLPWNCEGTD